MTRSSMGRAPRRGDTIWVIDSNAVVHRAYHSRTQVSPTGVNINAVVGWLRVLRHLRIQAGVHYIVPVFDGSRPGWRDEIYPAYKSSRPPQDEELLEQWPRVFELNKALHLRHVQVDGVEADDMIASYVEAASSAGISAMVVSNDKDLMQLVRGEDGDEGSVRQVVKWTGDLEIVGPPEVEERQGVAPALLGDLLALAGDSTDSIPGVRGIGMKTGAKILREHGDLESALERWSLVAGARGLALRDGAADARLSRRLVELRSNFDLPILIRELRPWAPLSGPLDRYFRRLGYAHHRAAMDLYPGEE